MKTTNKVYRQGDVLIEQVSEIPAAAIKQASAKRLVLAHGEVTGHHHVLVLPDATEWYQTGSPVVDTLEKPGTLAGEMFVRIFGGKVVHDEHAEIELPAGTYKISRQREYSPKAIRNVAD